MSQELDPELLAELENEGILDDMAGNEPDLEEKTKENEDKFASRRRKMGPATEAQKKAREANLKKARVARAKKIADEKASGVVKEKVPRKPYHRKPIEVKVDYSDLEKR